MFQHLPHHVQTVPSDLAALAQSHLLSTALLYLHFSIGPGAVCIRLITIVVVIFLAKAILAILFRSWPQLPTVMCSNVLRQALYEN